MAFYLGIDSGGSKTTCVVGDENSILGTATSGGSNIVRSGESAARAALEDCIRQACRAAQIEPAQVTRVCIGMAGAARPSIQATVRRILAEILSSEIKIVGDMAIALQAAFDDGPGVVVIAGTGSIAYGRNHLGQIARAGGWGHAISDEGSGHWVGRTAIGAALRARDERRDSALLRALQQVWRLETPEDLVRAANAIPPPDFASVFPQVLAVAEGGDPTARAVLTRAGTELAVLAMLVMGRIFPPQDHIAVTMCGGVLRSSALVREAFCRSVESQRLNVGIRSTLVEPVKGALELARRSFKSKTK